MAATAYLSLAQVLQLARYELGYTQGQIAGRAFLQVAAYDAIERGTGRPMAKELEDLMNFVPFLQPLVMRLSPTGPQTPMIRRLQASVETLEQLDAETRATRLERIRLELDWRDGKLQSDHPEPLRPAAGKAGKAEPLRALWTRAKALLQAIRLTPAQGIRPL